MELWLDTTNIRTIQTAVKLGLLSGVTTNPTLIARSGRDFDSLLEDLLHYQEGPVAAQVVTDDAGEMVQQGQSLYSISNRIIIKVPLTKNGLEAIHLLSRQGIPTMATAIFHPSQALLAALTGADYVAPYLASIEKNGGNPWSVLKSITNIFQAYRMKTKILGASILNIDYFTHCAEAAIFGATLRDEVFEKLISTHPMTQEKVNLFAEDWANVDAPLLTP